LFPFYRVTALQQRSLETILRGHVPDIVIPPLGSFISALVSAALAYRASHLFSSCLPKWIFLGWVGVLVCTSLAGALLVMYNTVLVSGSRHQIPAEDLTPNPEQFLDGPEASTTFTFNHSVTLYMSASAAVDISISIALWINLRSHVGEGFEATDSILRTVSASSELFSF
jgi:hypothetical protein